MNYFPFARTLDVVASATEKLADGEHHLADRAWPCMQLATTALRLRRHAGLPARAELPWHRTWLQTSAVMELLEEGGIQRHISEVPGRGWSAPHADGTFMLQPGQWVLRDARGGFTVSDAKPELPDPAALSPLQELVVKITGLLDRAYDLMQVFFAGGAFSAEELRDVASEIRNVEVDRPVGPLGREHLGIIRGLDRYVQAVTPDCLLDISGWDLSTADLYGYNLSGLNMAGADLSGLDLRDAAFWGSDLTGVNFRGADLKGARMRAAVLRPEDLLGARNVTPDMVPEAEWEKFIPDPELRGLVLGLLQDWDGPLEAAIDVAKVLRAA